MAEALPLRAALKRGTLVTLANWPVVLVEFVIESLYKASLGLPILAGGLMVAVLLGADVRTLFDGGIRAAADQVFSLLASAPVAMWTFLAAVSVAALGGAVLMFLVKAGTLAVLVVGDHRAGELAPGTFPEGWFDAAYAYDAELVVAAARRFAARATWLTLWLGIAYAVIAGSYVASVTIGFGWAARSAWASAWPVLVLLATSTAVVGVAAVNLTYDLLRVVIVTDDCGLGAAVSRLRRFLLADARQVVGIFGVMGGLLMVATAVSIVATAGLNMVFWVPFAGLLVVPLQIAAWVVRGLVFQGLGLVTLSSYQTQYRRFSGAVRPLSTSPMQVPQA